MKTARTVVITGAAGGIGALLVERFRENGDRVVATDLDQASLVALPMGEDAVRVVTGDISNEEDCARIADAARAWTGRIDILINCAGFFPLKPFEELTPVEWRRVVDINLTGVFLMTRATLPLMKANGWGRIINFGSGSFFKGAPNHAHYVAAKGGVIGLSRALATELGGYNITVNVVTPGLTLTKAVVKSFPTQVVDTLRRQRAIQRDQQPEDLVGGVFFLASPEADFMTGQILNVDGGGTKY